MHWLRRRNVKSLSSVEKTNFVNAVPSILTFHYRGELPLVMLNDNNIDNNQNSNINNDYSIINISSVHESIPLPQSAPYGASKGGMELLTKTVALELADKGIRVNGIALGAIATDMNKEVLQDKEKKKQEEDKIPMHRIGQPEEIAKVALFLTSPDASYITGTTIYADGGLTLSS
jgi:NAD(P)-dependent dehydrogenase (short-subunit alcohol dehydrogenase family)